jgi:NADP-dependent 3-hydroxy acid dehydrogenase YdfG
VADRAALPQVIPEAPPVDSARPLLRRLVVLAGSTGALGEALAGRLAGAGASLLLVARDKARLEAQCARLEAEALPSGGGRAVVAVCDVANRGAVRDAVVAAERDTGLTAWGLVTCVGALRGLEPVCLQTQAAEWGQAIDAACGGLVSATAAVVPSLASASARGGHLVCFGGDGTERGGAALQSTFVAAWAKGLEQEVSQLGVKVSLINVERDADSAKVNTDAMAENAMAALAPGMTRVASTE